MKKVLGFLMVPAAFAAGIISCLAFWQKKETSKPEAPPEPKPATGHSPAVRLQPQKEPEEAPIEETTPLSNFGEGLASEDATEDEEMSSPSEDRPSQPFREGTNEFVLRQVEQITQKEETSLRRLAGAYNVDLSGTFIDVKKRLIDVLTKLNRDAPAPEEALDALAVQEKEVVAWREENSPPPPKEGGNMPYSRSNLFAGLAAIALAIVAISALIWFFSDDDDSTRDRLVAALEDDNLDQIDNILEDENFDDDVAEEIKDDLEELVENAEDEDEVRSDLIDTIQGLAEDFSETELRGAIAIFFRNQDDQVSEPGNGDPTPAPTTAPTQTPGKDSGNSNNNGNACQPGDKVGTWSEGNSPHRIEVGGHGLQHLDFYPSPGVKAISYAVGNIPDPEGVPDLAWGYGSIWEWNPPGCDYDLVADLSDYANARLDSGHSGLVVQWGTWEIIKNVGNLSNEAAEDLVGQHRSAFGDEGGATVSASSASSCPAGTEAERLPDNTRPQGGDTVWTIGGDDRSYIANVWNPAVNGGAEHKLFVAEGESKTLTGYGGAVWAFPVGCEDQAKAEYEANALPAF